MSLRRVALLLPICAYCKRIRSADGRWDQIDPRVAGLSDAELSHGICPGCMDRAVGEFETSQLSAIKTKA